MRELEEFLNNRYGTISINYSDFEIANSSSFQELQEGYRLNSQLNESFIGTEPGDWKGHWFVIGYLAGDPVFVDITNNSVYTSPHGMGVWHEERICESLDDFELLLNQLKSIAENRDSPDKFEKNPIDSSSLEKYTSLISKLNAQEDFWLQFVAE